MALTSRSIVLQRLGVDAVTHTPGAIAIALSDPQYSPVTVTISSTTLVLSDGATGTYTLADYTMQTLSDALDLKTEIDTDVVDSDFNDLPATLLTTQAKTITFTNVPEVLTFTNPYSQVKEALIDQLITEVDYKIARFCNRYNPITGAPEFELGSRDEYYDGDEQEILTLRGYPVGGVTSVGIYGTDGVLEHTMDATDYQLDRRMGTLRYVGSGRDFFYQESNYGTLGPSIYRLRRGWPRGHQNIRVQYTAGYSTVPYDLQSVATDMVVEMYLNRRRNTTTLSQSVAGAFVSYQSPSVLGPAIVAKLQPYRREVF